TAGLQDRAQPEPDQLLVVREQHPDHAHPPLARRALGLTHLPLLGRTRPRRSPLALRALGLAHPGSTASTRNPPSSRGSARRVPPTVRTRSRRPIRPRPPLGSAAGGRVAARLVTVTASSAARRSRVTVTGPPGACLPALVSASCTTR